MLPFSPIAWRNRFASALRVCFLAALVAEYTFADSASAAAFLASADLPNLTGVLKLDRQAVAFFANDPGMLFSGQVRDGFELISASLRPAGVQLRVHGEAVVSTLAPLYVPPTGPANSVVGCACHDLQQKQLMQMCSIVSHRTAIQDVRARDLRVSGMVFGNNEQELLSNLKKLGRENGSTIGEYGEKFIVLVRTNAADLARFHPRMAASSPDENIPAGTMSVQGMPFDDFAEVFEMFTGNQLRHEPSVHVTDVTLQLAGDLTRAQLAEGFELFLFVNGYRSESAGPRSWRIIEK